MVKAAPLFLLFPLALSAQDWARQTVDKSPRHREWVTLKHDGRSVSTFVAYPEVKDKAPVIVVIHEIFGMTDWVEDMADQFAEAGYIATLRICSPAWRPTVAARRIFRRAVWVPLSGN
jgi:carboxymethylenebutenolidase